MTTRRNFRLVLIALISVFFVTIYAACGLNLLPKNKVGFSLELPSDASARGIEQIGGITKYAAIATWKVSGTSPSTDSKFTQTFPSTAKTVLIDDLKPGDWNILVTGLDTGDRQVFYATTISTLVSGENKLVIKMQKDPTAIAKIEVTYKDPPQTPISSGADVNCGELWPENSNSIKFSIKNTGNSDLVVSLALDSNSEGFAFPVQPKSPVAPLETVTFDIIFSRYGNVYNPNKLNIFSNDPDIPQFVINLKGSYCS